MSLAASWTCYNYVHVRYLSPVNSTWSSLLNLNLESLYPQPFHFNTSCLKKKTWQLPKILFYCVMKTCNSNTTKIEISVDMLHAIQLPVQAVCQWLVVGQWFSLVSSTNKTDRHNITEMLLKVVLNTITFTYTSITYIFISDL